MHPRTNAPIVTRSSHSPARCSEVRRAPRLPVLLLLGLALLLSGNAYAPAPGVAARPSAQALAGYSSQLRRYPYLTDVVGAFATINWATDASGSSGSVTWGKADSESCTAHSQQAAITSINVNGVIEYQWRADLTLEPDTRYCYRVFLDSGGAAIDLLGSDPAPVFVTQIPAGASTPYTFAVLGDWGDVNNAAVPQAQLLAHLAQSGARFALTVGDNGHQTASQRNYGDLVQTGPSVSAIFAPQFWAVPGRSIPLFPTLGNHDLNSNDAQSPYLVNWPQGRAVALSGGRYRRDSFSGLHGTAPANYPSSWYAFDAGVARFYLLSAAWADSNLGTSSSEYEVDYDYRWRPDSPQYQWLVADLASHPTALKFAFFHYPLYSDNAFQSSDTYLQGAGKLEGLLRDAGVTVIFNGHAHIYQRNVVAGSTSYVLGGTGVRLQPLDGGCSSADAYGLGYSNSSARVDACGAAAANPPADASGIYHYVLVTIGANSVTVTPIDSQGRAFDQQVFPFTLPNDTSPPSVPQNLGAQVASGGVALSWSPASDDGGVIGYDIFRNGVQIASVGSTPGFMDSTVAPTTTYQYRVRARDGAGNTSALSGPPVEMTTPEVTDTAAPSIPIGLTATSVTFGRVELSWAVASDNVGVTGYDVFRNSKLLATIGTDTSFADGSAVPNTAYRYQVRARDAAGNVSALSSPALNVTTPAAPTTLFLPLIDN
jgi:chitodextrinase